MGEQIKITAKKSLSTKEKSPPHKQKTGFRSQSSHVDRILFLQRTIGNQAVQRLIKSGTLQAKLRIGQPVDVYEQEADRVAEQVMRMPEPQAQRHPEEEKDAVLKDGEGTIQTKPLIDHITLLVQRQLEPEEEEEEPIMTKNISSETEVKNDIYTRLNLNKGGGQPLPEVDRSFMERRFGADFSGVRVHTDSNAVQMSRELNAEAFTHGRDVYFGTGRYSHGASSGKRLLAHELTHVVQQNQTINKIQPQNFDPFEIMSDFMPEDPLHAGIIIDYRRRHGLSGDERPSDAELKDRLSSTDRDISTSQSPSVQRNSFKQASSNCPSFVSLTARGINPTLNVQSGRCRFSLGYCPTPRGTCGRNPTSGMVFEATVDAGAGCTGQLAFMQNVLSINRRAVLANGTPECLIATTPHHDGGPPWKGCRVSVIAPGRTTIISDDCPSSRLDGFVRQTQHNNPRSVSINDRFKMYLMWRVAGSAAWIPIANVTWAYSGSISLAPGATGTTPCTSRYTINSASHTDGTGTASSERPVTSPSIDDLSYGPCPAATRTSTPTPTTTGTPSSVQPAQLIQNPLGMRNCNLFNPRRVRWSFNASSRWLNRAVPQIRQFPRGPNPSVVHTALIDNFHTIAASDVTQILQKYNDIQFSLSGLTVDCYPRACLPGDLAWVLRGGIVQGMPIPHTTVHLCPDFWGCNNTYKIGGTFIHERAHTENNADDHAYEHYSAYASLTPTEAIDNADSYAVAARQIYYNGAHGPGETC